MTVTERITTGFGFSTTTDEVMAGVDLSGRRAVVTGAGSGLGAETARSLAAAGADVVIAVRRPEAAEQVAAGIRQSTGNKSVRVTPLDLADPASVRSFTQRWQGPLHVLVNNAAVMAVPDYTTTAQGWELQFATNYVGHFALALGLHRALSAAEGARVVAASSSAHLSAPVVFDDIHFRFRQYDPWYAYGQSKTAAVLFAVEAARRWAGEGIEVNAFNPGAIATGLQRYTGGLKTPVERRKTPQQGAATTMLLAASPQIRGVTGRYFEDCNEADVADERPANFGGGVARYAVDPANAERLWRLTAAAIA
ncbi:SDR family NAD(P)-dependent oxidoreductase [Streptomyces sp. NPDC001083]|uniref:SDR family NAD(P)-dependent oxidoreductase n=1 Tax=Streptomyces sp. NPDC001083 TaxID=3364545 RepID=UPI0036BB77B0